MQRTTAAAPLPNATVSKPSAARGGHGSPPRAVGSAALDCFQRQMLMSAAAPLFSAHRDQLCSLQSNLKCLVRASTCVASPLHRCICTVHTARAPVHSCPQPAWAGPDSPSPSRMRCTASSMLHSGVSPSTALSSAASRTHRIALCSSMGQGTALHCTALQGAARLSWFGQHWINSSCSDFTFQ